MTFVLFLVYIYFFLYFSKQCWVVLLGYTGTLPLKLTVRKTKPPIYKDLILPALTHMQ